MEDWRDETSIINSTFYKKKFAYWPTECSDGQKIWFKPYYTEYKKFFYDTHNIESEGHGHVDYIGDHSEETYMIKRLAE